MVDYYGLPKDGPGAWPGRAEAPALTFDRRADCVEQELLEDVFAAMGPDFDPRRFIPYVVMHEFEGLLFSDPVRFGTSIGKPELAPQLQSIRNQFTTPEEINDSPDTAPSKRVLALMPGYEKPLYGVLAVIDLGIQVIRRECPLFGNWITRLEKWPQLLTQ